VDRINKENDNLKIENTSLKKELNQYNNREVFDRINKENINLKIENESLKNGLNQLGYKEQINNRTIATLRD
jgi:regulator of replication initiation timing